MEPIKHAKRLGCLLLATILISTAVSGCASRSNGTRTSSAESGGSSSSSLGSEVSSEMMSSDSSSISSLAASRNNSVSKGSAGSSKLVLKMNPQKTTSATSGGFTTPYGNVLTYKPYTETSSVGSHFPEVYVGSSLDYSNQKGSPNEWSYVRQNADGFYINFINMNDYNFMGLQHLAKEFSNKHAYFESDNVETTIDSDQMAIDLLQMSGFSIPYTSLNYGWSSDHQSNLKTYDLLKGQKPRYCLTQSGPWCCNGNINLNGKNGDFTNEQYRSWIGQSDGMSTDGPLGYWQCNFGKMQQGSYSLVKYAHSIGKKAAVMVCPYEAGVSSFNTGMFLSVGENCVRAHEDNDAEPDIWIDFEYAVKFPVNPESSNGAPSNTLNGMAYYLLKHIRGDAGTLDLSASLDNGAAVGKKVFNAKASSTTQKLNLSSSKAVGQSYHIALDISNYSSWCDYAAVLKASGSISGWNVTMKQGSEDITNSVKGNGYEFYKNNRLNPSNTKTVDITMTRVSGGTGAMTLNLELLPHIGNAAMDSMQIVAK